MNRWCPLLAPANNVKRNTGHTRIHRQTRQYDCRVCRGQRLRVPLIMAGPGIKAGTALQPIYLYELYSFFASAGIGGYGIGAWTTRLNCCDSLPDLESRRADLLGSLSSLGDLGPGSIVAVILRCGKTTRHCAQPEDPGHGPSLRLTHSGSGVPRPVTRKDTRCAIQVRSPTRLPSKVRSAPISARFVPNSPGEFCEAERTVVIGDGAPWIWNIAQEPFPKAIQIVDQFERLGQGSPSGQAFPGQTLG